MKNPPMIQAGHVYPPANWLVWQGFKSYASPTQRAEFARRSFRLFMHHGNEARQCFENYRSDNGKCGDHPNYTWGRSLELCFGRHLDSDDPSGG